MTRELLAVVKRLRAIYRKRTGLPAAMLRAHLENLQALERELLGVPANAAPEPGWRQLQPGLLLSKSR